MIMFRSVFLSFLCFVGVAIGALLIVPRLALAASCHDVIVAHYGADNVDEKALGGCNLPKSCASLHGEVMPDNGDCSSPAICCGFAKGVIAPPTPLNAADLAPKPDPKSFELENPIGKGSTLFTVIRNVITFFVGMVGALALGVFVYAGVTWMTAGSSDRIQKAKDAMKYAVIGLALIAFAFAITTFFIDTLTGKVQQQSLKDQAAQQKAAATPPPVNP